LYRPGYMLTLNLEESITPFMINAVFLNGSKIKKDLFKPMNRKQAH